MLVVRIEIWPFGREEAKRTIGTAVIGNDGTGDSELANYNVYATEQDTTPNQLVDDPDTRQWEMGVCDYDRRKGFWLLVSKALERIHVA